MLVTTGGWGAESVGSTGAMGGVERWEQSTMLQAGSSTATGWDTVGAGKASGWVATSTDTRGSPS